MLYNISKSKKKTIKIEIEIKRHLEQGIDIIVSNYSNEEIPKWIDKEFECYSSFISIKISYY